MKDHIFKTEYSFIKGFLQVHKVCIFYYVYIHNAVKEVFINTESSHGLCQLVESFDAVQHWFLKVTLL